MTGEDYGYVFGLFLPFIISAVLLITGIAKNWSGGAKTFWLLATLFTLGFLIKHAASQ